MKDLSGTFLKGLAAVLPATITLYLLFWVGGTAEAVLGSLLQRVLPEHWYVPGMGLLAGLLLVLAVGIMVNAVLVRQILGALEDRVLQRIPLVKTVYGAVQDLMVFFAKPERDTANQVVMVTLGDTGFRVLGFVTRQDFNDVPAGIGGDDIIAVYMPMSYQIGGYTVMMPRSAVEPIDMSVEDGMRFAVTAGMSLSKPSFADTFDPAGVLANRRTAPYDVERK
jgi:uncharacterized membrane protein